MNRCGRYQACRIGWAASMTLATCVHGDLWCGAVNAERQSAGSVEPEGCGKISVLVPWYCQLRVGRPQRVAWMIAKQIGGCVQ